MRPRRRLERAREDWRQCDAVFFAAAPPVLVAVPPALAEASNHSVSCTTRDTQMHERSLKVYETNCHIAGRHFTLVRVALNFLHKGQILRGLKIRVFLYCDISLRKSKILTRFLFVAVNCCQPLLNFCGIFLPLRVFPHNIFY